MSTKTEGETGTGVQWKAKKGVGSLVVRQPRNGKRKERNGQKLQTIEPRNGVQETTHGRSQIPTGELNRWGFQNQNGEM